jgi:hypothetical protein
MWLTGLFLVPLTFIFISFESLLSAGIPFDDILKSMPVTHMVDYQANLTDLVSNHHRPLNQFMMKDENHIFHSVKNEPSHTVDETYNRAQPLSALQPQSSSEQVTRNNLPVIMYNSQIRVYRHNNISQSNYLDSSFSLTTSRHESKNGTTIKS